MENGSLDCCQIFHLIYYVVDVINDNDAKYSRYCPEEMSVVFIECIHAYPWLLYIDNCTIPCLFVETTHTSTTFLYEEDVLSVCLVLVLFQIVWNVHSSHEVKRERRSWEEEEEKNYEIKNCHQNDYYNYGVDMFVFISHVYITMIICRMGLVCYLQTKLSYRFSTNLDLGNRFLDFLNGVQTNYR